MKVQIDVPDLIGSIFEDNPEIGRRGLVNMGLSHYDAAFYAKLIKEADVVYGINQETEKAVILSDIHYPEHSRKCLDVVMEFLEDYQPHYVIYLGDQLENECFSSWKKDIPKTQALSAKKDYDSFNVEILKPIEGICSKSKYIWFTGNHEDWTYKYIDRYPKLKGLIEPENVLNLKERGYTIIPFNNIWKFGKLRMFHGFYWNLYHARKTIDEVMHSCVYGHDHTYQVFTKTSAVDLKEYYTAYSIPCLCTLSPAFQRNRPNRHVNGLGIAEKFDDGCFNLYVATINDGRFAWNGKVYQ